MDSSRQSTSAPGAEPAPAEAQVPRRRFLGFSAFTAMAGGLIAGYGTFAAFAGRYLYPASPPAKGWMYVTELDRLSPGESLLYRAPNGAPISITRQGGGQLAEDFIALSTVCPHLGCQVHWESQNNRYFCPCHNGVFDPSGLGTAGPPKGQTLARYPLRVENRLLFIEVPTVVAAAEAGAGLRRRTVADASAMGEGDRT